MDTRGLMVLGVGVLMILAGFFADMIGLGAEPDFFGWKQIALIVVGSVVVVIGVVLGRKSGTAPKGD